MQTIGRQAQDIAVALGDRKFRSGLILAAGAGLIVTSLGAAFIPLTNPTGGARLIGSLLILAGVVEVGGGVFRLRRWGYSVATGLVTCGAGVAFVLNTSEHFFSMVYILIGWLAVRTLLLLLSAEYGPRNTRLWILASAFTDLLLAVILMEGLSVSTLTMFLFGPTPIMVAGFACVVAVSLVMTGCLMIEIAASETTAGSELGE